MTGEAVLAAARAWIGTPYIHQAGTRGAGADCLGLVLGVWRDLGGRLPRSVPPYTPGWAETGRDEALWSAARDVLRETTGPMRPGQVMLFRLRDGATAKHLGILAGEAPAWSFIHAYSGRGVVESPLSEPWARRIVARFEFP